MRFLRTEYAALVGMILILLATVKHAFEVYLMVMYPETEPSLWQMIYIAVMLIAIDFAVLIFTIHGNSYAAQTFAFLIFLVNLFAFWQHIPWPGWNPSAFGYIPGFLFSGMFAYGLYYFTDVFSDLISKSDRVREARERVNELEEKISVQKAEYSRLLEEKETLPRKVQCDEVPGEELQDSLEKAKHFELLVQYIVDSEGYTEKSIQALKKGVEYWSKKQREEELDTKGMIKLWAYRSAYSMNG